MTIDFTRKIGVTTAARGGFSAVSAVDPVGYVPAATSVVIYTDGTNALSSSVDTTIATSGMQYVVSGGPFNEPYFRFPPSVLPWVRATGANMVLGTEDFTIEGWIRAAGSNTFFSKRMIFNQDPGDTLNSYIELAKEGGSAKFRASTNDGNNFLQKSASVSTTSWTHFAVARGAGQLQAFMGGSEITTVDIDDSYEWLFNLPSQTLYFESQFNTSGPNFGETHHMGQVRVTIGQKLYSSSFTPPTAPFVTP